MTMRSANAETAFNGALTATKNGPVHEFYGGAGNLFVTAHVSAVSGTSPTLNLKLQDSPDNSTWSDVTGATGAQLTAAGNQVFAGYSTKPYVRVVATVGGTTPSFTAHVAVFGVPA